MRAKLISSLISILLSVLTPELLKQFVDTILDWVEVHVLGMASQLDDRIVLSICGMIRDTFDIPDD